MNLLLGTATGEGNDTLIGIENVITGAGADSVIGTDSDNSLNLGAGNDTVVAGDGYDFIFGGAGDDSLDGGAGVNDTAAFTASTTFLRNFDGSITAVGPDGTDTLRNIEIARIFGFGTSI